MTSGVKWNEDYADPNSDVAKFNNHQPEPGVEALVSYMRKTTARCTGRHPLAVQHGRDQPGGHPGAAGRQKPLATYLAEKCGARQAWSSRPPGF